MGFSRQEYWSGLPCPPPGDLPDPGIEPVPIMSPALAGRFFTTSATWEAPLPRASDANDLSVSLHMFLCWTSLVAQTVKRLSINAGDLGSIPGSGRFPGEGNGNPLQSSCLENPMDRGAWCRLLSMGLQRVGHD